MELAIIICWWPIGFASMLLVRWMFEKTAAISTWHEPLTWGGVIKCAFAGVGGVACSLLALVMAGIFVGELVHRRLQKSEFLSRPVFASREPVE